MKKRELLVFAGQSNMMGAPVLPPIIPIECKDSYEYKDKERRLGNKGTFTLANHPAGEFSYVDIETAYSPENTDKKGNSTVDAYIQNTYFCPAMRNLVNEETKETRSFSEFSESTAEAGASLPPLLAMEWERRGGVSLYSHIAKGGVSIRHYLTRQMADEYDRRMKDYNLKNGTEFVTECPMGSIQAGAAEYFYEKSSQFFSHAKEAFPSDDTSEKILLWIQGESDAQSSMIEYKTKLEIFWEECKKIGFTKFFMIRIDFFGNVKIKNVMAAQEIFARENDDCYMMTRALSFMPYHKDDPSLIYTEIPKDEYQNCRDTAYGFGNPHINEKGFAVVAAKVADNMVRVLRENLPPILEKEIVKDIAY